jgi:imidazolonepropionase-like amidohydrolase
VPAVLRATREELKAGADFIKIMVGGGVASATDAIETVQYTAEEVQAITKTCWQMGRMHTTAHAFVLFLPFHFSTPIHSSLNTPFFAVPSSLRLVANHSSLDRYTVEAIRHAVDNGVKGIEHGNLLDRETAEYMAEKGIFLTPTLSCYGAPSSPLSRSQRFFKLTFLVQASWFERRSKISFLPTDRSRTVRSCLRVSMLSKLRKKRVLRFASALSAFSLLFSPSVPPF